MLSQRVASALLENVVGPVTRSPASGFVYSACQRPDRILRTLPNDRRDATHATVQPRYYARNTRAPHIAVMNSGGQK